MIFDRTVAGHLGAAVGGAEGNVDLLKLLGAMVILPRPLPEVVLLPFELGGILLGDMSLSCLEPRLVLLVLVSFSPSAALISLLDMTLLVVSRKNDTGSKG